MAVHAATQPDHEVTEYKKACCRAKHGQANPQHRYPPQQGSAQKADAHIPGPGDRVVAQVKRIAVHHTGQVHIRQRHDRTARQSCRARPASAKEQQSPAHGGEVQPNPVQGMGHQTGESGQQ